MEIGPTILAVLLIGFLGYRWIKHVDKKRKAIVVARLRDAQQKSAAAKLAHEVAKLQLHVAEKSARGECLSDEELLILARFATEAGLATPEQKHLVESADRLVEVSMSLDASQERLADAMAARSVVKGA